MSELNTSCRPLYEEGLALGHSVSLKTLRAGSVALAAAILFVSGPSAAAIIWSAPVDSTGRSTDVITAGQFLDAGTFGPTTTVNGVTFTNTGIGLPNTANYGVLSGSGTFTSNWDPEYRNLVKATAYFRTPSYVELQFGQLEAGSYMIQLFLPQWDVNWATAFSLNGVRSAPVQAGGNLAGGPNYPARRMPQWISVNFDADGVTDYTVRSEGLTTFQLLSAYQLRTAPDQSTVVPEPSTWAMMILGFGLAGAVHRRRRVACPA